MEEHFQETQLYHLWKRNVQFFKKNKKKIFKKINSNAEKIEKQLNDFFIKKNLDLKVYRFKSMLRLVYSKKYH